MKWEAFVKEIRRPAVERQTERRRVLLHLGATINAERNAQRLSQRALAAKAGITQRQVSLLENGNPVTTETLAKVTEALGLDVLARRRLASYDWSEQTTVTSIGALSIERMTRTASLETVIDPETDESSSHLIQLPVGR